MTTARSSFSFARIIPVYRNMLRRYRGTALFYGALGFLFLPVQYLLTILQNQERVDEWRRWTLIGPAQAYNAFSAFFFTALMLIVPLLMAGNLFSYLHNRRSVDVYHSLPLTRAELFGAGCMAGMTLIWGPLAVNFVLTAAISFLLPGASAALILIELVSWMVITLAIFAITAFCAVELGTDFDTAIFSLGLNGALAAVYLMFVMLTDTFIYGYKVGEAAMRFAYRLSPVSLIIGRISLDRTSTEYLVENNWSMLAWLIASLAVLALGAWRYTQRKSELAESVGEMGPLQIFMRSAGTLLGGTSLGLILCAVFEVDPIQSRGITLFCIAVGSLLVYFIGDVILTRNVRSVVRALPVALITAAGVLALVGSMMFDLIGFGKWVPDIKDVKEVRLNNYQSRFAEQNDLRFLGDEDRTYYAFGDPEAVALVIAAQQAQIDLHRSGEPTDDFYRSLSVTYEMEDGRSVSRRYSSLYPSVLEGLVALEVDDELLTQSHPAFLASPAFIDGIVVTNALGSAEKKISLTDEQEERLLVALRQDLLSQPVEELKGGAAAVCNLTLELKYTREQQLDGQYVIVPAATREATVSDRGYNYATSETLITESYRNTLAILKEFGVSDAMENDWSQVKAAYALPFNRGYNGTITVGQTDLNRVMQTKSDVADFLEYYRDPVDLTLQSFAFSPMELSAIRGSLTSIAPTYGEAFAVVAVAAGDDPEILTGCFLAPVSALPAHLKEPVARMVEHYYGGSAVESWGYGGILSTETTNEMVVVS